MTIQTVISFIFLLLITLTNPVKASVSQPATKNITVHQTLTKSHVKAVKKVESMTILAIFLCVLAGSLGVHRVVMGGSPWLIMAYAFTFGGFFLLLPFMDFFRLLSEPIHYKNNNKFLAAFGGM